MINVIIDRKDEFQISCHFKWLTHRCWATWITKFVEILEIFRKTTSSLAHEQLVGFSDELQGQDKGRDQQLWKEK